MTDYALTLSDVAGHGLGPASLAVLPGEIAGLVGPAGAGKSRLLRVAAGSLKPRTGEARVWGVRATHPAARRLIGYACDSPAFPCALTVEEVLTYYARLDCADNRERSARGLVRDALEIAGLTAATDLRADTLGRADLHRLSFAQAALGGRRVLLLDETLSGLDAFARRDLCGRIAVMRDGRIVRAGPLATLIGERILEVILDAPPAEPPPGFRVTAAGLEASLTGRTVEAALALCRAHRLPVRASRVRVKSLEEVVLETHDGN